VNSHDGSTALRIVVTPIRVACWNSLALAIRHGHGVSIRHTASAPQRVAEARRALAIAHHEFDQFESVAQRMGATRYTESDMAGLVSTLFPGGESEPSARTEAIRRSVQALFSTGIGHEDIAGTAWAALQAVTEYVDHHRPSRGRDDHTRADTRLTSAWFGSGSLLKRRAYEHLLQHVAA
jgi:phage/plasmid-like protein (TIGR03299 family)